MHVIMQGDVRLKKTNPKTRPSTAYKCHTCHPSTNQASHILPPPSHIARSGVRQGIFPLLTQRSWFHTGSEKVGLQGRGDGYPSQKAGLQTSEAPNTSFPKDHKVMRCLPFAPSQPLYRPKVNIWCRNTFAPQVINSKIMIWNEDRQALTKSLSVIFSVFSPGNMWS